jgi:hypothetical protein
LAETGLFNGLQRIQIEKSGRSSTRASGCEQNGSTSQAPIISGHQGIISKLLIFANKNQSHPRGRANALVSVSHWSGLAASRWCFNTIAFMIILIAISCFCRRLRPLPRRPPGITDRKRRRRREGVMSIPVPPSDIALVCCGQASGPHPSLDSQTLAGSPGRARSTSTNRRDASRCNRADGVA